MFGLGHVQSNGGPVQPGAPEALESTSVTFEALIELLDEQFEEAISETVAEFEF